MKLQLYIKKCRLQLLGNKEALSIVLMISTRINIARNKVRNTQTTYTSNFRGIDSNTPIPHWSCAKDEIKLLMYRFLHLFLSTTKSTFHPTRKHTFWFWFQLYPLIIGNDFRGKIARMDGTTGKKKKKLKINIF